MQKLNNYGRSEILKQIRGILKDEYENADFRKRSFYREQWLSAAEYAYNIGSPQVWIRDKNWFNDQEFTLIMFPKYFGEV